MATKMEKLLQQLPCVVLPWYAEHKRDLPWRRDKDPYHIWVSEIMLQQTRVEAVKGYYARFLEKLPTVTDLANAPDDTLHKLWEGLGYYNRVRNMKKAAQVIINTYGGEFPKAYEEVLALPGIGPYTAGAICSIAYDLPTPAVDGNVIRVLSRLLADSAPPNAPAVKKNAENILREIYPERAGDFTQALMELGATVCGPNQKPDCENCPCKALCKGFALGIAHNLPVKVEKKPRRIEEKTVFLLDCDDWFALERRPNKGLLAGLWQFPNTEGTLDTEQAISYLTSLGLSVKDIHKYVERCHIFTHVQWNMRAYYISLNEMGGSYTWMRRQQVVEEAALPTAFRMFWE